MQGGTRFSPVFGTAGEDDLDAPDLGLRVEAILKKKNKGQRDRFNTEGGNRRA